MESSRRPRCRNIQFISPLLAASMAFCSVSVTVSGKRSTSTICRNKHIELKSDWKRQISLKFHHQSWLTLRWVSHSSHLDDDAAGDGGRGLDIITRVDTLRRLPVDNKHRSHPTKLLFWRNWRASSKPCWHILDSICVIRRKKIINLSHSRTWNASENSYFNSGREHDVKHAVQIFPGELDTCIGQYNLKEIRYLWLAF